MKVVWIILALGFAAASPGWASTDECSVSYRGGPFQTVARFPVEGARLANEGPQTFPLRVTEGEYIFQISRMAGYGPDTNGEMVLLQPERTQYRGFAVTGRLGMDSQVVFHWAFSFGARGPRTIEFLDALGFVIRLRCELGR